jgi:acetyltransferase-like isoleucine patch superfamily enzyme
MQNPFDAGYYCSEELRGFGFKSVGDNVSIAKTCKIVGLHNIEIGDNSRIDDFCTLIATGPLVLRDEVHIHGYCQIGARGGVTFDERTALAAGCLVYSASDSPLGRYMVGGAVPAEFTKPVIAPVHFQRHSGAFAQCTILPGVTMHEGAMACAHSLVARSVPEWTIASGTPADRHITRSRRLLTLEGIADAVELAA